MVDVFERVSKKVSDIYKQTKPDNGSADILDKRQRWVAGYINEKGFIRTKEIVEHFKVDKKTARNWIDSWLKQDFIKQKDLTQKRNIEYILNKKF